MIQKIVKQAHLYRIRKFIFIYFRHNCRSLDSLVGILRTIFQDFNFGFFCVVMEHKVSRPTRTHELVIVIVGSFVCLFTYLQPNRFSINIIYCNKAVRDNNSSSLFDIITSIEIWLNSNETFRAYRKAPIPKWILLFLRFCGRRFASQSHDLLSFLKINLYYYVSMNCEETMII